MLLKESMRGPKGLKGECLVHWIIRLRKKAELSATKMRQFIELIGR